MATMDSGKSMTTSLFQDEEDTTCHISNEIEKWVKPRMFNLYDQRNKRVDKSQIPLNGPSLKVNLGQDTNGYMQNYWRDCIFHSQRMTKIT